MPVQDEVEVAKVRRKGFLALVKDGLSKIDKAKDDIYEEMKRHNWMGRSAQAKHYDYDSTTGNIMARWLDMWVNCYGRKEEYRVNDLLPVRVLAYDDVVLVEDKFGNNYRYDQEDFKYTKTQRKVMAEFADRESPEWFYERKEAMDDDE